MDDKQFETVLKQVVESADWDDFQVEQAADDEMIVWLPGSLGPNLMVKHYAATDTGLSECGEDLSDAYGYVEPSRQGGECRSLCQAALHPDSQPSPRMRDADTFEERTILTRNRGLVIRMADGSEFQVTIVQSRRPGERY